MHSARIEQLLNLVGALRPDLDSAELYELAVGGLSDLSGYPAVVMWRAETAHTLRPLNYVGLSDSQQARMRSARLPLNVLDVLRQHLHSSGEAIWWPADRGLPSDAAALGIVAYAGGHSLLLPMLYNQLLGVVVLSGPQPQPEAKTTAFLQQCVDQVTVALAAADTVKA
ncbi:hypothetical protein HC891_11370 [Candidatus Gracilibacteria bacterium]|nr:hypothetical protein [Candidatus Gracilibacteria bacterium]